MNLYEWEGKRIFVDHGIKIPKGVLVRRGDDAKGVYEKLGVKDVVLKAQVLSGKRGKNNGIIFCSNAQEVEKACAELFLASIRGQNVAAVLMEEKINIIAEHYLSITYDTNRKQPVLIYSTEGGMDIEDVGEEKIRKMWLDVRSPSLLGAMANQGSLEKISFAGELWGIFLREDARVVEINPLVKTESGEWYALDAKMAIDEDAFYRHESWKNLEPRTMMGRPPTEREQAVRKIDEGENYYRGTAGKYIEMDGDVAILFSGGGASIANMDALLKAGCKPANYSEYSGNPPREKVYQLTKIALSKPGLKGLWIAGGVANFTNIAETFGGIADALEELKPTYPIVIRRAGPFEEEGMRLMKECADRNGLTMKFFDKETSMSETAEVLAEMVGQYESANLYPNLQMSESRQLLRPDANRGTSS